MLLREGAMFQSQNATDLGSFSRAVLALESMREGLWNCPLQLRKATEARCVAGVPLQGGQERPLCEAVKVRPRCLGDPARLEMPGVLGYRLRQESCLPTSYRSDNQRETWYAGSPVTDDQSHSHEKAGTRRKRKV